MVTDEDLREYELDETIAESWHAFAHRRLPDGRLVAVCKFAYTYGLMVDVTGESYTVRYCYEDGAQALADLCRWNGAGDPPGPWIKAKGLGRDELNPNFGKGES